MSKLDITIYTYQKTYFNSIISETLFNNMFILAKKFGEETLNKLLSDFKDETEAIYTNVKLFEKITDLEVYQIIKKSKKMSKNKFP